LGLGEVLFIKNIVKKSGRNDPEKDFSKKPEVRFLKKACCCCTPNGVLPVPRLLLGGAEDNEECVAHGVDPGSDEEDVLQRIH
jgi:hypothetical protein